MHNRTETFINLLTGLFVFLTTLSLLLFAYDGIVKWAILSYLLFLSLVWIAGKAGHFRSLTLLICGIYLSGYQIDLWLLKGKTRDQAEIIKNQYACAPRAVDLLVRDNDWELHDKTATKEIHGIVAARRLIYRNGKLSAEYGPSLLTGLHKFPKCTATVEKSI